MTSNIPSTAHRSGLNWRMVAWGTAVLLLLLPLAAMQFTNEVNWTPSDFVFAAVLIGGVGLIYELAVRRTANWSYRAGVAAALAATFLLFWANGAVGIIGSESNPYNLLFLLVPVIALIGSIAAKFRPSGLARAMLVTAAAQALVGPLVLVLSWGNHAEIWPKEIFLSSVVFAGVWLLSAWLFGRAARNLASA